jgi:hypothetical protein
MKISMSRTFLALAALSFFAGPVSSSAFATDKASDLGGEVTLKGNMSLQDVQKHASNGTDSSAMFTNTNIKLTAELSENVKAVLMFRIRQELSAKGYTGQAIEKILSEAYIQIDHVGGKPVAFIIGKQTVPFGNLQIKLPNYELDPIVGINYQRDVIGFTVQLEDTGFFDLVEASVFETKAGDLSIGEIYGASVRLTKEVNDKVKIVSSAMHKGNGSGRDEERQTVGFLFNDGHWTLWAEGIHMDGHKKYPDSKWSAVAGAEYKIDKDQRVVAEISYINDALTRISLAYEVQVAKDVYVSPEMAYITRSDGTGEWQYTLRSEVRFESK